jgi:hypothetical protein
LASTAPISAAECESTAGLSGTSQDHPQTVAMELDPVDYRLEQISSSGIGQQTLPQALCFGQ